MIHALGEHYGQCKRRIESEYTELDYWQYLCIKSNEGVNQKLQMNK